MRRLLKTLPMLAVFILPPEWDDIKFSVRSPDVIRIYEQNYVLSASSYPFTIADRVISTRLKCVRVPKIPCSTGNVFVYGAITATYLVKQNPNGTYTMPNLKRTLLLAEDGGDHFRVCPVIFTDDWGSFFTEYDYYQATGQGVKYRDSYADVEVWQVCR